MCAKHETWGQNVAMPGSAAPALRQKLQPPRSAWSPSPPVALSPEAGCTTPDRETGLSATKTGDLRHGSTVTVWLSTIPGETRRTVVCLLRPHAIRMASDIADINNMCLISCA
jgi:hypothetical protein